MKERCRRRDKLVVGIGINDASYSISSYKYADGRAVQTLCPFYSRWKDMLRRCYSESFLKKRPTYRGCSVCEEWITFSNFKAWMETQDWEGMHLDKDLLVYGNTVYSPKTCAFVPDKINTLIGYSKGSESGYIGIYTEKRGDVIKYSAQVSHNRKRFGIYLDASSAHNRWQTEKANEIESSISWYATQGCFRTDVAEALMSRVWKLRLDASMDVETKQL